MQKTKLFCFPHAGGSAFSYAKWKNHFNPYIEVVPVELAGRGYRIEENLYQSMEEAVNDVYNKISSGASHFVSRNYQMSNQSGNNP